MYASAVDRPARWDVKLACFVIGVGLSLGAGGCSDKPKELDSPAGPATNVGAIAPLAFEVPGAWTKMGEAQSGSVRAKYTVPKTGVDTADAEVWVYFFGTGSLGDPEKNFKEWFDQFDGNPAETAERKKVEGAAGTIETVEFKGTYKIGLGPQVGPKKKSPMQMVKENWRLFGGVVRTKDRGNWFFKLIGPNETVEAAKDALKRTMETAK